ncbi:MAG: DUF6391 domain-containing protein [Ardenticatenaceae bacterium]
MLLPFFGFLLLLPITLFALVPFGFALVSFRNLITLPFKIFGTIFDKRRRRNHALEHATVHILEQRYSANLPIGAFAEPDGFFIQGALQPQLVLNAAKEGLQRLQAGETQLALHPRCGTMIVSGLFISPITFFGMLIGMNDFGFFSVLFAMFVAIIAARVLAQPVGLLLQRTITTSTDVQGLYIDRLESQMPQNPFALILTGGLPTKFRVWTSHIHVEQALKHKRYKAY